MNPIRVLGCEYKVKYLRLLGLESLDGVNSYTKFSRLGTHISNTILEKNIFVIHRQIPFWL